MSKPTIGSLEATPQTKALWDEMQNVLRNEEAWEIIQRYLKTARLEGMKTVKNALSMDGGDECPCMGIVKEEILNEECSRG